MCALLQRIGKGNINSFSLVSVVPEKVNAHRSEYLNLVFFAGFFTKCHIMFFSYLHSDFYYRSRMAGKYLLLLCKKLFHLSAHTCPFRRLRRHLPRVRGRLTVRILFFLGNKSFTVIPKRNSPLPSFLSGEQNRNDNKRKNGLSEGAKNPA